MNDTRDDARLLHVILERCSSLFRASLREVASAHDLKLVQLEALVYLSLANRYSDNPGAVAEYLGITKGTASQTVLALERRGLVSKVPDAKDKRLLHLQPTVKGKQLVDHAYPSPILRKLPPAAQTEAASAAQTLLRALQIGNGSRAFGQCRTCAHFQAKEDGTRCGLTGETLTVADALLLCRENAPAPLD